MKSLLKSNILATFNQVQTEIIRTFSAAEKLFRNGVSQKEIGNKLNISRGTINAWINKRSKPVPLIITEEFESRYLKYYNKKEQEILAYLVGYNLGDGHISRNFCHTWFYGVSKDLEVMKELFKPFGVNPILYNYKIDNGKMAVHDRIFSRLLFSLGAIQGNKTETNYLFPKWIQTNKHKRVKIRCLQGLFDSELSKISKIKGKNSFQSLKFYQCKEIKKIKGGILFLNQIKNLLSELGISTTQVRQGNKYVRKRDGHYMVQLYFIIHSNSINLYNFIETVGFLYNSKRRELAKEALPHVKKISKIEKKKIKQYYLAKELRKQGLSAYQIADKTNLNTDLVKNWVYRNSKPRLLNSINNSWLNKPHD